MKITWLGQAGFLFETDTKKILIDPYLSNSVEKIQSQNYRRKKVNESYLRIKPDIILLTHNHLDHTDPETLCNYLSENSNITVLASKNAYEEVRKFGGPKNNYVLFNNGSRWTDKDVCFLAVKAEHSDDSAIGIIITYKGKNYYITGDTLYNENVFRSLPKIRIHALFLPINGKGNNMNKLDASFFAKRIKPKFAIPMHFGMFDEILPQDFDYKKTLIPTEYISFEI